MNIDTFISHFTCFFEAVIMFQLFNTFMVKRDNLPKWINFIGVIFLTILIRISNIIFSFGVMNAVGVVAAIFIASFLYESRIGIRLVVSVLGVLLATVVEIIVLFAIAFLLGVSATDIVNISSMRIFGTILSKAITYVVFQIVCYSGGNAIKKGTSFWIMFFMIFATSVLTVFLFFNLSYNHPNQSLYDLTVVCSIGVLVSASFTLYLYDRMAKQNEIIANQRVYRQQLKDQSKHLDEILVTHNEMKKFRHDLVNHIISIKAFIQNKDVSGGIQYLNKINDLIENSSSIVDTGNIALDAIISSKKALAESKLIDFNSTIQIPENISIEPIDISIIFGNALDNAIEACERIADTSKRWIKISVIYDDSSIICKIINSCLENKNEKLISLKQDKENHGYGMGNIKSALEKYNHIFKISNLGNEFTLTFVIFK